MVADSGARDNVKLIAFYLTQFHPIPENDLWWGKGFTEWTNVTKATPLFVGHYQPHLPTDMGFYDLRLRETRREQIKLAKSYGIDGFCYHYYWFSGKRLLEKPLDEMLADPESDMPFCLCWANENWTRRWDAAEHEVLIAQEYKETDDLDFIKGLLPFFKDPRYIRIEGAPLLVVYRPQQLPDAKTSVERWRKYCADFGIPKVHLACALTHGNWDHAQYGFDSGVEFPPHNMSVPNLSHELSFFAPFSGQCMDYKDLAEQYLGHEYGPNRSVFRGVVPSWDNTARRSARAGVLLNSTPENYSHWLSRAIRKTKDEFPGQQRPIFINAWNEWAEGCHLEPDRKHGLGFLKATVDVREGSAPTGWDQTGVPEECRLGAGSTYAVKLYRPKRKNWLRRTLRKVKDRVRGRARRG